MSSRNLSGGLEVKGCGRVRLTSSVPSVSKLSRKYENLDVSKSYGPSGLVTGIALPFSYLTEKRRCPPTLHLRMEADPISKTFCSLKYCTMGKVKRKRVIRSKSHAPEIIK
jgi:predicted secreted protein